MRPALVFVTACLLVTGMAHGQAKKADPEAAKLAKLETSYKAAKAKSVKKPKDAALRKAYVAATVSYGTAMMNAGSLPPRQKYPGALNLYREALKVDPKNKEATENKKMIEDIYRSMGRPIPK